MRILCSCIMLVRVEPFSTAHVAMCRDLHGLSFCNFMLTTHFSKNLEWFTYRWRPWGLDMRVWAWVSGDVFPYALEAYSWCIPRPAETALDPSSLPSPPHSLARPVIFPSYS